MVSLNRRHFLKGVTGALGAIGLSQLHLIRSATYYGQTLAQQTPRKVALLIGINDYRSRPLGGPLNDVELQRQLLINRFGFKDRDIHVLCDEQASRRNVLGNFNEYLYEPAMAGDVVVFHFSGHGERIRERDRMRDFLRQIQRNCTDINAAGECNSLYNTAIATSPDNTPEQDIMGHTLLLMRAALAQKTENVPFLLDCCYAGGGKRGNAVMRSLNSSLGEASNLRQIPESEWTYQRQLLDTLGWDVQQFADAITSPKGQGFFVGAARYNQLAADYSFDGFTAGAFTYLLTQHLWQNTDPLAETIPMVINSSTRLAEHSQVPVYDPARENDPVVKQKPIYHISPTSKPAEALIIDTVREKGNDDQVTLWLGGLDPWSLESFDQGAIFSVIDKITGDELVEVQQIDGTRQGLIAQGRLLNPTRGTDATNVPSQLLQEKVRGISNQVTLKVGLDDTLTAAEQQIVLNNLGELSDFDVFVAEPGKVAHVLLGRYTDAIDRWVSLDETNQRLKQTVGSIGIFSPAQAPLVAGSFGPPGEAIDKALERLKARFVSLYIGRMLALMINQQTSHIDVSVEVEHLGSRSGTTTRGGDPDAIFIPQQFERGIEKIAIGNEIKVTVNNNESKDLHFGIVVIDAAGEVNVLFPPQGTDDETVDVIPRHDSWSTKLKGAEPLGIAELLVLVSPQSLVSPLKKLRLNAPNVNRSLQRGATVANVDAMDDIFGAMDTRRGSGNSPKGTRLLDVDTVAVLSLFVDIVPGDAS